MRFQHGVDESPTRLPISATDNEASSCRMARILRSVASIRSSFPIRALAPGSYENREILFFSEPGLSYCIENNSISSFCFQCSRAGCHEGLDLRPTGRSGDPAKARALDGGRGGGKAHRLGLRAALGEGEHERAVKDV